MRKNKTIVKVWHCMWAVSVHQYRLLLWV